MPFATMSRDIRWLGRGGRADAARVATAPRSLASDGFDRRGRGRRHTRAAGCDNRPGAGPWRCRSTEEYLSLSPSQGAAADSGVSVRIVDATDWEPSAWDDLAVRG